MKSKLLPIADLNAILLSIFLVLSLGASRGIIDREGEPTDDELEVTFKEDNSDKLQSYVFMFWTGSLFQFKSLPRQGRDYIAQLSEQAAGPTKQMTRALDPVEGTWCSAIRHTNRLEACRNAIVRAANSANASILQTGQCGALGETAIGRAFQNIIKDNQQQIMSDTAAPAIYDADGESVYFNNFDNNDSRKITVSRHGREKITDPIDLFGVECREEPRAIARIAKSIQNQCTPGSANPNKGNAVTMLNMDANDNAIDGFDVPSTPAAKVVEEFAEKERHVRFRLVAESGDQNGAQTFEFELAGHGQTSNDLPENVIFQDRGTCEAYAKNPDEAVLKKNGSRVGLGVLVQLFEVHLRQQEVLAIGGLERVK